MWKKCSPEQKASTICDFGKRPRRVAMAVTAGLRTSGEQSSHRPATGVSRQCVATSARVAGLRGRLGAATNRTTRGNPGRPVPIGSDDSTARPGRASGSTGHRARIDALLHGWRLRQISRSDLEKSVGVGRAARWSESGSPSARPHQQADRDPGYEETAGQLVESPAPRQRAIDVGRYRRHGQRKQVEETNRRRLDFLIRARDDDLPARRRVGATVVTARASNTQVDAAAGATAPSSKTSGCGSRKLIRVGTGVRAAAAAP